MATLLQYSRFSRSHGQGSLAGFCHGLAKESDTHLATQATNNTDTVVGSEYALSPHRKLSDRNDSSSFMFSVPLQVAGSGIQSRQYWV